MPEETEPNWLYDRKTGTMRTPSGGAIRGCYSGHGAGLNNVAYEAVHNVGPLPAGTYRIERPEAPITHLGPLAMRLTPDPLNDMFGRSGFFIHGDNHEMDYTASDGCIVAPWFLRDSISRSNVTKLVVV